MADTVTVQKLRASWIWMALFAVISLIGGVLALVNPMAATLAATLIAGWTFMLLGAIQFVHAFQVQRWPGFLWALALGVLLFLVGLSLVFNPLAGMVSLTLLVAMLFLVTGIVKIVYSFSLRPVQGWAWVLFSGLVSVALAILIIMDFPWSARSILGILLGVELLSNGVVFMLIALGLRRL